MKAPMYRPMNEPMKIDGALKGASAATPLLPDLVAYWDLDEASGVRADGHTNGYNLTDNNTVGQAAGVGAGQFATDHTATFSEYLSKTAEIDFQIGVSDFEINLRIRFDLTATFYWVLSKGQAQSAGGEYEIYLDSSQILTWRARKADDSAAVTVTSGTALSPDTWYNVNCRHDATAQELQLRVDDGTAQTAAIVGGVLAAANPLYLGVRGTGSTFFWDGRLQACGIWNGSLRTTAERAWLATAAAAKLYADVSTYTG